MTFRKKFVVVFIAGMLAGNLAGYLVTRDTSPEPCKSVHDSFGISQPWHPPYKCVR